MKLLDRLTAWLDRREVVALRKENGILNELTATQKHLIAEQVKQIANANGRVARSTDEILDLKRKQSNDENNK